MTVKLKVVSLTLYILEHIPVEARFPPTEERGNGKSTVQNKYSGSGEIDWQGTKAETGPSFAWRLPPSYLGRVDPSPDTNRVHFI